MLERCQLSGELICPNLRRAARRTNPLSVRIGLVMLHQHTSSNLENKGVFYILLILCMCYVSVVGSAPTVRTAGPNTLEAMPYGTLLILIVKQRDLQTVLHQEVSAPALM